MALSDLTETDLAIGKGGSKYTYEQKVMAVATFFVEQNLRKTAEAVNVPYDTVRSWKARAPWWPKVMREVQKEHKDKFCSDLYRVVGTGLKKAIDGLENGDEQLSVDYKTVHEVDEDGNKITRKERIVYRDRVPVKAKDAMIIAATAQDKLERLENGGLLEEAETINDKLNRIADTLESRFQQFARTYDNDIEDAEIIEDGGRLEETSGSEVMEETTREDRGSSSEGADQEEKEKEEEVALAGRYGDFEVIPDG
jgi:hypothetical protein